MHCIKSDLAPNYALAVFQLCAQADTAVTGAVWDLVFLHIVDDVIL